MPYDTIPINLGSAEDRIKKFEKKLALEYLIAFFLVKY